MKRIFCLILLFVLLLPIVFAADGYKPYLHKAAVPEAPKIKLFGAYQTNLFPGAATYSFPLEVPKGTNGLQPSLAISYNSQAARQRPGILGAGWVFSADYIQRDINFTTGNTSDDEFILNFQGSQHELMYSVTDSVWHTKIESFLRIQRLAGGSNDYAQYWLLTTKDGTKYRFGYRNDSELTSNTGKNYAVKWSLDQIEDTHGNQMTYTYAESVAADDLGAVYLDNIDYNQRAVYFTYENSTRPDQRVVFEQGNRVFESRRLTDVSVYAAGNFARRYHYNYTTLAPSLSSLSQIVEYGTDNQSSRYGITFEYYLPEPGYSNSSTYYVPPTLFSGDTQEDLGVRLLDVNNDGFIDILQGRQVTAERKAWINDHNGSWSQNDSLAPPEYFTDDTGRVDKGSRFADINRDGFTDFFRSVESEGRRVYLNNGTAWVNASLQWSIPLDFASSSGEDYGVQLIDLNNDGLLDMFKARAGETRVVYLNNGTGWVLSSNWVVPVDFVNAGVDRGVRLLDINSDGLQDILQSSDFGTVVKQSWLNNGSGWVNATSTWQSPLFFTTSVYEDTGIRFDDVNGDGLTDIIESFVNISATNGSTYLNTGNGWVLNNTWVSPEPFVKNGLNIARRLADVNGDGLGDIIVAVQADKSITITRNQGFPFLLKRITNAYGGVTLINYTPSTQFNNSENGVSELGFAIYVVKNATSLNGLTNDFAVNSMILYNYSFGKYDYNNSEFRGFGLVREETPSAVVMHYFHQDIGRKGKEYRTEVSDGTKNYSLLVNGFASSQLRGMFNGTAVEEGIYNVTLEFSSVYRYDGNFTNPVVTNISYDYDGFGNVIRVSEDGDVAVVGDERVTNFTYAQGRNNWIVGKVSRQSVYSSNGEKTKESLFYYDNVGLNGVVTRGSLTKKEDWNDQGNNSLMYFMYDVFGNVIRQTDSLGNSMSYTYDSLHTVPVGTVNALGHVTSSQYNYSVGGINYEEKNGIRTNYQYDTFGRITSEIRPYDSASLPTKKYNYSFDGSAPEEVVVALKTTANKTNTIHYFYDGEGRIVQLKNDVEEGRQVVKNIFYDSSGRVRQEQNPYFSNAVGNLTVVNTTGDYTVYTYDAVDRVIGIYNPDGSIKNVTFDRKNITDYDEKRNRHTYTVDGLDRISKVYEFMVDPLINLNETYMTSYSYDSNNNLISIVDNEGNSFEFTYDSLGRKISMNDPDLGAWTYRYDTNGRLVSQSGGGGNLVTGDGYYREYDGNGRLLRVRSGSTSSSPLLESYAYDPDGQRIKITRNDSASTIVYTPFRELMRIVNVSGTYDFTYVYESDTLVARVNPDGTKQYEHSDHLGSTSILTNQTGSIIESTLYSPFGEELSGGDKEVKGYTGQFDDEATGQMYYGARYYLPRFGFFTQWDPVMQNVYDSQLLNHYSYARNNPYAFFDPDGKEVVVAIKHTDLPVVGDVGHIAFVSRNPDATTSSESYIFYSDQGPAGTRTAPYYLKSFFGFSLSGFTRSTYRTEKGSTVEEALPDIYYDTFTIETTPEQERQIIAAANEIMANPQIYAAPIRNSQDFVIDALGGGDVELDRSYWPENTFKNNEIAYDIINQFLSTNPYEKINKGSGTKGSRSGRDSQADALARYWDRKNKKG